MPDNSSPHPAAAWNLWVSALAGAIVLVALIAGLLILPARNEKTFDPFAVICRALGLPGYEKIPPDPGARHASAPVSEVAWDADTQRLLNTANAARGAVLAKTVCGACHGVDGKSTAPAQFPNLAGLPEAAIYKELQDFRAGNRTSPFMQPVTQTLKNQQMADVAAYYSTQPGVNAQADTQVPARIISLVRDGDPERAIPPCDSCHGEGHSGPEGAPVLLGQSVNYLEQQLKSFAADQRHNDLFERMRVIARQLSAQEMHDLAAYYHGGSAKN